MIIGCPSLNPPAVQATMACSVMLWPTLPWYASVQNQHINISLGGAPGCQSLAGIVVRCLVRNTFYLYCLYIYNVIYVITHKSLRWNQVKLARYHHHFHSSEYHTPWQLKKSPASQQEKSQTSREKLPIKHDLGKTCLQGWPLLVINGLILQLHL